MRHSLNVLTGQLTISKLTEDELAEQAKRAEKEARDREARGLTYSSDDFRQRFTRQERKEIRSAAKTDDQVDEIRETFSTMNFVNTKDNRVLEYMDMLVSKNMITKERYDEILSIPANDIAPYI